MKLHVVAEFVTCFGQPLLAKVIDNALVALYSTPPLRVLHTLTKAAKKDFQQIVEGYQGMQAAQDDQVPMKTNVQLQPVWQCACMSVRCS